MGKEIRYQLPDGRELTAETDNNGELKIDFDTTPFNAGVYLEFSAKLISENIITAAKTYLAAQGFYSTISLLRRFHV